MSAVLRSVYVHGVAAGGYFSAALSAVSAPMSHLWLWILTSRLQLHKTIVWYDNNQNKQIISYC